MSGILCCPIDGWGVVHQPMTGARGRGGARVCGRGTSSVCAPRLELSGGGAVLRCGAELGAALSARPGGFGRPGWILWPSGDAHSPTPFGLPGSAQSPSPRGLSESAQSPFPARPGPRPSDALALAGQLLLASSFLTILAMTCRLRLPLLSLAFRDVHPRPRDSSPISPGN